MAEDILRDLNEKIKSSEASMKTIKLSKLLPPIAGRSRKHYRLEGDLAPQLLVLPQCIARLLGMGLYKNISRSGVTFTSSKMKEV